MGAMGLTPQWSAGAAGKVSGSVEARTPYISWYSLVFRVPPTNVVSDTHHLLTTRVLTYCIPLYFSHFAAGC